MNNEVCYSIRTKRRFLQQLVIGLWFALAAFIAALCLSAIYVGAGLVNGISFIAILSALIMGFMWAQKIITAQNSWELTDYGIKIAGISTFLAPIFYGLIQPILTMFGVETGFHMIDLLYFLLCPWLSLMMAGWITVPIGYLSGLILFRIRSKLLSLF